MRIGVYAILDDNDAVDGWIEATQSADVRLVLCTESHDTSRLDEAGVNVHFGLIDREDDALNTALTLLPSYIDVCFRVDMKDRPRQNWRSAIESAWKPSTNRLRYPYRSPAKSYYESHVHSRTGFRWSGPVHAALHWRGPGAYNIETTDDLIVDYVPQDAGIRLALLKEGLDETRSDYAYRTFFYADGLLREGYLQDGLAEVHRYVELIGNGDMVAYLWRQVAIADEPNALQHLLEAQKAHSCASNYLGFAEQYLRNQEWGQCYSACQFALSLLRANPQPMLAWSDDARLRGPLLHDIAATAAWNLWDFEAAYGHAVEALRRAPADEILRAQVASIRAKVQAGATLDPEMKNEQAPRIIKLSRVEPVASVPQEEFVEEVTTSVAEQAVND